jgi:protein ImuA
LRRRVAALERGAGRGLRRRPVGLGLTAVDGALPAGGLEPRALHELLGGEGAGVALTALLAARSAGLVLWCRTPRNAGLHAPGLAAFGLMPDRLLLAHGRAEQEVLWAMEEGLRSGRLAAVVGEARKLDLVASRRLQLAAEAGGGLALLLRPPEAAGASAARTRWRIAPAPGAAPGWRGVSRARWRLDLLRCRGANPRSWTVDWDDATHSLHLAAPLADRPAEARPAVA